MLMMRIPLIIVLRLNSSVLSPLLGVAVPSVAVKWDSVT